jgi:hypothetical protein
MVEESNNAETAKVFIIELPPGGSFCLLAIRRCELVQQLKQIVKERLRNLKEAAM